MIKNIFFDLDGTLINSKEGITKAFEYALNYFNIKVNDRKKLEIFIGPPLRDSFIEHYKFNEEQTEIAVKKFREYYSKKGVNENELYEGVKELLKKLKEQKKVLIIATSKPQVFTEKILKRHEVLQYFDFISGATLDSNREKKADIIEYAVKQMNINNTEECIMIGDKHQDMEGAKANNMKSIGVTYGFGTKEELINSGATYIINNILEVKEICEKIKKL